MNKSKTLPVLVLVLLLALVSSTYAWFVKINTNTTGEVDYTAMQNIEITEFEILVLPSNDNRYNGQTGDGGKPEDNNYSCEYTVKFNINISPLDFPMKFYFIVQDLTIRKVGTASALIYNRDTNINQNYHTPTVNKVLGIKETVLLLDRHFAIEPFDLISTSPSPTQDGNIFIDKDNWQNYVQTEENVEPVWNDEIVCKMKLTYKGYNGDAFPFSDESFSGSSFLFNFTAFGSYYLSA